MGSNVESAALSGMALGDQVSFFSSFSKYLFFTRYVSMVFPIYLNQVSYMQIANYFRSETDNTNEFAVGLDKEFTPLKGHDIGQFPGLESESSTKESPSYQLAV